MKKQMPKVRRAGLLFSILLMIAALAVLLSPQMGHARPSDRKAVAASYRDEGNAPIPFTTACTGSAWTQVAGSTDSIRRAFLIQISTLAATGVCLATTTKSGDLCSDTLPHVEIAPGASYSDYSGGNWQCRTRGGGTVNVFGSVYRDSGDYGAINQPR